MRWAGHVARIGEDKKVYTILVGKLKWRRPLGRPRRRWEDGIRMDLRKPVEWIQMAQGRNRWRALVNTVMNLRVLAPRSELVSWLVGWLVGQSVSQLWCMLPTRNFVDICLLHCNACLSVSEPGAPAIVGWSARSDTVLLNMYPEKHLRQAGRCSRFRRLPLPQRVHTASTCWTHIVYPELGISCFCSVCPGRCQDMIISFKISFYAI
jgi:hypothetical protein